MSEREIKIKLDNKTIGFGLVFMMVVSFGAGILFSSIGKADKVAADTVPEAVGAAAQAPSEDMSLIPEVTEEDHIRGDRNAKAVVVTYTDFECPFCKQFHPTMEQVLEEYGNDVAWVYRNYPLSFHPKAQKSAESAECVAELGGNEAYWKFVDEVFAKMPALEVSGMADIAANVGVDKTKFQACVDSGKYAEMINDELNTAAAAGIQGTPGSAIIGKNGKRVFIPGALPFEQVKQLIEQVM